MRSKSMHQSETKRSLSNCAASRSFHNFLRKLVQYCVLKGYLRRVREYRVSLDDPSTEAINGNESGQEISNGTGENGSASKTKPKKLSKDMYDGTHDMDSLACLGHSKCREFTSDRFLSSLLASTTRSLTAAKKTQGASALPSETYLTLWK